MPISSATYPSDGENPYSAELLAFIEAAKAEAIAEAQAYVDTVVATLNENNDPETFTNKSIALGTNTVTGTVSQFNTALTDGNFATIAGTETISNKTFDSSNTFPAGTGVAPGIVLPFAGGSVPSGWLLCNGQTVSRTTYSNLYAAIGDTWGDGDGSTTFEVPDLRDSVPVGVSASKALGTAGGAPSVTLTVGNLPAHAHSLNNHTHGMQHKHGISYRKDNVVAVNSSFQRVISVGESSGNTDSGNTGNSNKATTDASSGNTGNTGSGTAVNIQNPYKALNYIIKT